MTAGTLVAAVPARSPRDWRGRGAWGRDAHLMQALVHVLGEDARLVAVLRTRIGGRRSRGELMIGGVRATTTPQPVELPGWTRRRLPAAVARRAARRVPRGVPASERGLVACFDLLRYEGARRLARERGWPLVTDLMDDWRRHPSMPAWRAHLEDLLPRLPEPGDLLTSVTAVAASPGRAVVVPNAGFHDGDHEQPPRPGPDRPVAAFVGTIHPRIDADLILTVRRELTGWDVVAAGPVMSPALADRLRAGGVTVEPWWDMREIDSRATVLMAPYVRSRFTESADPLKVYEATARGVPCVSTVRVGAPPASGLAVVEPEDFVEAVEAARWADRSEVIEAARATGSWEDRATTVLGALGVEPATQDGIRVIEPR